MEKVEAPPALEYNPRPWRTACGLAALAGWLVLLAGTGCASRSGERPGEPATSWFQLVPLSSVTLRDEGAPILLLGEVVVLADGGMLTTDNRAGRLRHFAPDGRLLRCYAPPEEWRPIVVQVDEDEGFIYANDFEQRLWRFRLDSAAPGECVGSYDGALNFLLHPSGAVIGRGLFPDGAEIRTYRGGSVLASFLPSDERNIRLGKPGYARVTVDKDGLLYARQNYWPVVRKFNLQGEELGSWEIRRNEYFRDFPDDGPNPYEMSHDWDFLERWRRSFTSFAGIYWVPPNLVCVFQMNDPPERPNVLDVYTTEGEYVGSAATNGYLVGARGRRLYFTDFHVFPSGDCVVKIYELPEELPVAAATRGESETKRKENS
ncbi:MAG: hypothetical protein Kow00109_19690 [Acidobacteriota bacterium]